MLDHVTGPPAQASQGFRRMFREGALTLGVFFPIEAFGGDRPTMEDQEWLARRAEELGFAALWFRDVPLRDPSFGDVGQVYDPWVYLSWIAAQTNSIALATGAIVLPLRHPLHTAKASASIDRLSGGRLVLGVASGDRATEFPAFDVSLENRAELFRENISVLQRALAGYFPEIVSSYGRMQGVDLAPKPLGDLPILVAGSSRQTLDWIAEHADGWVTYPRAIAAQRAAASKWHAAVSRFNSGAWKPFAQSFCVDLSADPLESPIPIHLGFRGGRTSVLEYLEALREVGVAHVALNLKCGRRPAADVIEEIGTEILPKLSFNRFGDQPNVD